MRPLAAVEHCQKDDRRRRSQMPCSIRIPHRGYPSFGHPGMYIAKHAGSLVVEGGDAPRWSVKPGSFPRPGLQRTTPPAGGAGVEVV